MHSWVRQLAGDRLPQSSLRWSAGLGLFATALLLRWGLDSVLLPGLPFITFFVAVLIATLVGGLTVLGHVLARWP
jgi:hypothetical protein